MSTVIAFQVLYAPDVMKGHRAWYRSPNVVLTASLLVTTLASSAFRTPSFGIASGFQVDQRPLDGWGLTLAAAQCLPLLLRHRPVVALAVSSSAFLADDLLDYPPAPANVATLVLLYQAGVEDRPPRISRWVAVVALAAFTLLYGLEGLLYVLCVVSVWLLGRAFGAERRRAADARGAERRRLTAEVHDALTHHVAALTLQAGVVGRTGADDAVAMRQALADIEATGRAALEDLRRLLALDDSATHRSLRDAPALLAAVRRSGVTTDLVVTGSPRPLGGPVEHTLYRVLQEALSNVLRHAGATRVRVHVVYGADRVEVEVRDDGRGPDPLSASPGSSYGLAGMRERLSRVAGHLYAGPAEPTGFVVRAVVPVEENAHDEPDHL